MVFYILLIIAIWYLPLPLVLQICLTIFGVLHCLVILIRAWSRAKKKLQEETVNNLIEDYLPKRYK